MFQLQSRSSKLDLGFHNTRLDKCCGVDAQSKSILEDDIEVNNLQSKLALLDQTGKTSHTSSWAAIRSVLMIAVEAERMKKSLSQEKVAQNERNAIFAHNFPDDDELPVARKSGSE